MTSDRERGQQGNDVNRGTERRRLEAAIGQVKAEVDAVETSLRRERLTLTVEQVRWLREARAEHERLSLQLEAETTR
jgi:hypothetical protein